MSDVNELLDHPRILNILFYPRRARAGRSRFPGARDGTVDVGAGVAIGYRLFPADDPTAPALLYFHGNGEIAADYDGVASLYTERGISLLVADYRGYGWSTGRPKSTALLGDARAVADAFPGLLGKAGLEPRGLFVMGRSLGSACAIDVAAQNESRWSGLIIESGFANAFALLARLGLRVKGTEGQEDGIDSLGKIARLSLPTLVIHGKRDILIPASEGVALHEACGSPDKRLLLIPRAGHNNLMAAGLKAYMQAISDLVVGAGAS
jgi:alpha-beta hydrolase superfamily lysophospholipase